MKPRADENQRPAAATPPLEEARAADEAAAAAKRAKEQDVTPWLRALGFRGEDLRRAAAHCESMPDASLEQRVKAALSLLAPKARTLPAPGSTVNAAA